MSAHNSGVAARFGVTGAATITGEFVFYSGGPNELRITPNGVKYRGEFAKDAGEVYRALNDVMNGKPLAAPVAQAVPVAGEWVSVSERLPALGERVLAHGAKRLEYAVARCVEAADPDREIWELETTSEYLRMYRPTHWMPLPPPPQVSPP